ncbi:hypothetical protein ABTM68_19315, partial [Acinetobacter baumannii]
HIPAPLGNITPAEFARHPRWRDRLLEAANATLAFRPVEKSACVDLLPAPPRRQSAEPWLSALVADLSQLGGQASALGDESITRARHVGQLC